jgi:cytochrome c oxidase accessory protein FixG
VRDLLHAVSGPPAEHRVAFAWMAVTSAILYFDFAWFREQVCLVVCPYGRLQSVLIDVDTAIIGYDGRRGEPRGKPGEAAGDCIDCGRCIAVCPTGIDIRNGLQMECVGCANCIDACDEIMERAGRPRGLIRYDSQRGFEQGTRRRLLRPRVLLYAFLGLLGLSVSIAAGGRRATFEVRALRNPGLPYVLDQGVLRNVLLLDLQNKENAPRTYVLALQPEGAGAVPSIILPESRLRLGALESRRIVAVATLPLDDYREPVPLRFSVRDSVSGVERAAEAKFLGP